MQKIREAAVKMASLSVYRGILEQETVKALQQLLQTGCHTLETGDLLPFARDWGALFSSLCRKGRCDDFAGCLTQAALFDENVFSLECAAGKEEFSPVLCAAVERDLSLILELAALTPDDLLQDIPGAKELQLPRWETGRPVSVMQSEDLSHIRRNMQAYYSCNGCGLYARYRAFIWRGGKIVPVEHPDRTSMNDLKGYDLQRGMVVDNTVAFLKGLPANHCLLYGDRGTGKSSTVKAILNTYYTQRLRVIEMPKESLMEFPQLVDQIAALPMKFIIFIDDLSFSQQDSTYASLKAVLEGGLAARPANTLIYATSNRRHLVRETFSDRDGDEVHKGDTIQESLSLADRFGLSVNFMLPDRARYLDIIRKLAEQRGLDEYIPQLEVMGERWATSRGGRSPRCATQFINAAEAQIRQKGSLQDL